MQSLTAFARLQARPQDPQFIALVRVFTSQPSTKLRLQSAKPGLQVPVHIPPTQPATPFAGIGQGRLHMPQLPTAVLRLVSHPFAGMLSQSPKPGEHIATVHAPPTQAAFPLGEVQTIPQRPQWVELARRSVSQPSAGFMLQSAKFGRHRSPHIPIAQVAVALAGTGQGLPQRPQFVTAARRSVSHPFAAMLSQSPKPPEHRPTPQRPIVQLGSALATTQRVPQPPQLAELLCVSTQASAQQSRPPGQAWPAAQPITQRFPRQT